MINSSYIVAKEQASARLKVFALSPWDNYILTYNRVAVNTFLVYTQKNFLLLYSPVVDNTNL